MIRRENLKVSGSLTMYGLIIIFALCSCNLPAEQGTETPLAGQDRGSGDWGNLENTCPSESALYDLWFSHLSVVDIDFGGGETIYLKFENIPPSFFQLWIEPSGKVTNEGIWNITDIGYQGTATYPDANDCPVQEFDGVWEMRAEISGECESGIVHIHIKEEWVDPAIHSSCGDWIGHPGFYSAPELDLIFDLSESRPTDGIQVPEGGPFYANYGYQLGPSQSELPFPRLDLDE